MRDPIHLEPFEGEGLQCETCTTPRPMRQLWRLQVARVQLELCSACVIVLRSRLRATDKSPQVRPNINLEDARRKRPYEARKR